MTIKVELVDGTLCRVVPSGLDLLLSYHLVRRFQRESGWAVVGHDPVRCSSEAPEYSGPERRHRFGVN